jgi:class 3 adenylate cyclase/predicted ATPase
MRFCGNCGCTLEDAPVSFQPANGHDSGQRRHLTVMFCDLVDSTSLAEVLDPEDFREVLSGYQHACTRAIERFNGYTAKYLGDGLVAYFGYPRAHEDDAQRAAYAGLGILDEVTALNARLSDTRGISLEVRIGIHTGVVIAGEMGAGETREKLAIVGDTPHIAARVESIAPPGSVVITDATHDLIQDHFQTRPLGVKALKGMSRRISVHRVMGVNGVADGFDVLREGRRTPMVGRDRQLAKLEEAWQEAKKGNGAVAHVWGEAGIGKSRLVCELRERVRQETGAQHLWQCSAHHSTTSLYPVLRLLERRLGLNLTQTPAHQLKVLHKAALDAGLDPIDAVPLLADALSVRGGSDDVGAGLTPRDARNATLRVLASLLVTNTAHHPLLLVVEDLQWADPTTIELLTRIIRGLRGIPLLCVLTYRTGYRPRWPRRQPVLAIELGPLSSDEVRAMAQAASKTALDPVVLERVDAAADGVPLFVAETVRMLELGGPDSVGASSIATVVPPTLQGLLTERLDRLPDLGDVIDAAAVLGREFERSLLETLARLDGADIQPALRLLAAQDVLRPVHGAPSRWEFTHALLQQAAYERLLRPRRQALHGRVAETLIRSFAAVAERAPEVIARHWSCAAEPAKAVPYWHAAGTRALERAAYPEAGEHFRRGFDALVEAGPTDGDDLQRVDFLTHLAASLQAGRGYTAVGVADAYAKARCACDRAGNYNRLVPVIRGQWLFYLLRAEYPTALDLSGEMMALGWRRDDPALLAEGHLYAGLVRMYTAQFGRARANLQEAFMHYQRHDPTDQIYEAQGDTGVMALAYLAVVLWYMGSVEEARERSDQSLKLAEQVGGPVTRAQAWGMRSMLHLVRAEPVEMSHWVEKTHAFTVDHNIGYWRTVSSLLSGWLQGRAGELELGSTRVQEALNAYRGSRSRLSLPLFFVLVADLRLAAGDQPRALEAIRAGEQHLQATGERLTQCELFGLRGRALMAGATPDHHGATVAYEMAVGTAHEQHATMLELRAATHLAQHQRMIGETCGALDQVASLCSSFPTTSEDPNIVRARALVTGEMTAR